MLCRTSSCSVTSTLSRKRMHVPHSNTMSWVGACFRASGLCDHLQSTHAMVAHLCGAVWQLRLISLCPLPNIYCVYDRTRSRMREGREHPPLGRTCLRRCAACLCFVSSGLIKIIGDCERKCVVYRGNRADFSCTKRRYRAPRVCTQKHSTTHARDLATLRFSAFAFLPSIASGISTARPAAHPGPGGGLRRCGLRIQTLSEVSRLLPHAMLHK